MPIKTCEVCKLTVSKYTCPVCTTKYCSVGCFKSHKSSPNCVKPVQENTENQPPAYQFETEDTVKPEKLANLRYDRKVREALKNRDLRNMLKSINLAENPDEAMENAMKEYLFHDLTVKCLESIEREDSDSE